MAICGPACKSSSSLGLSAFIFRMKNPTKTHSYIFGHIQSYPSQETKKGRHFSRQSLKASNVELQVSSACDASS